MMFRKKYIKIWSDCCQMCSKHHDEDVSMVFLMILRCKFYLNAAKFLSWIKVYVYCKVALDRN